MNRRVVFYLVVIVALTAGFLVAQEITGDIRGIVKDSSGAAISGAAVQVTNTDRNAVLREIKTGADGSYVATSLPVGHYEIVVEATGFKKLVTKDVVLNVHDHRIVDAQLQVGAAAETVNVEASPVAPELETSDVVGSAQRHASPRVVGTVTQLHPARDVTAGGRLRHGHRPALCRRFQPDRPFEPDQPCHQW